MSRGLEGKENLGWMLATSAARLIALQEAKAFTFPPMATTGTDADRWTDALLCVTGGVESCQRQLPLP
ncbi:hypothetical protein M0804_008888 [Polistes exclamans]|nr:hypothetical protein M0804_008888 [Polistes exclamans]